MWAIIMKRENIKKIIRILLSLLIIIVPFYIMQDVFELDKNLLIYEKALRFSLYTLYTICTVIGIIEIKKEI